MQALFLSPANLTLSGEKGPKAFEMFIDALRGRSPDADEMVDEAGATRVAAVSMRGRNDQLTTKRADHGWTPAGNVVSRTTRTGTSYDWFHGDRRYRVRIMDTGDVHLWIDGGHYELRGGVSHETKKSFSTNVVLTPTDTEKAAPPSS